MALKVLLNKEASPSVVQQFDAEAHLATSLTHPNVVYVMEHGKVGDMQYLAMEYIRGKTLHEVLCRARRLRRPVPIGIALFVARELLRALAYLHSAAGETAVHRDVAPSNVMLSYEGAVKLIDLGLAKVVDRRQKMTESHDVGQSRYMSPEQRNGHAADERSDLFPVGVMLWEMLTGRPLFKSGDDRRDINEIRPPSALAPGLPRVLDNIVMTALCVDPRDRFQSANEAITAITPQLSPEHDVGALEKYLGELFCDEIEKGRIEEATLVAAAGPLLSAATPAGRSDSAGLLDAATVAPAATTLALSHTYRLLFLSTAMRRGILGIVAVTLGGLAVWSHDVWKRRREPDRVASPRRSMGGDVSIAAAPAPRMLPQAAGLNAPGGFSSPPVTVTVATREKRRLAPIPATRNSELSILQTAESQYIAGHLTKAKSLAEEALNLPHQRLEAHLLLGKIYLQMDAFDAALKHYEAALNIKPGEGRALRGRELAARSPRPN